MLLWFPRSQAVPDSRYELPDRAVASAAGEPASEMHGDRSS